MLDLWDEVLVEWGFMLQGINLPLARLRQVDFMGWRIMLCFIHDRQLVHSDGHIPWLNRLREVSGMVCPYVLSNL
jgi:hypothetical protein